VDGREECLKFRVLRSDGRVLSEHVIETSQPEAMVQLAAEIGGDGALRAELDGYGWELQCMDPDGDIQPAGVWVKMFDSTMTEGMEQWRHR
jgi:hypothetical protein